VFIIYFKQIFLSITKFGVIKKIWGNFLRMSPLVSAGLDRTVPRMPSIGGLHVCAGGLDIQKNYI